MEKLIGFLMTLPCATVEITVLGHGTGPPSSGAISAADQWHLIGR